MIVYCDCYSVRHLSYTTTILLCSARCRSLHGYPAPDEGSAGVSHESPHTVRSVRPRVGGAHGCILADGHRIQQEQAVLSLRRCRWRQRHRYRCGTMPSIHRPVFDDLLSFTWFLQRKRPMLTCAMAMPHSWTSSMLPSAEV